MKPVQNLLIPLALVLTLLCLLGTLSSGLGVRFGWWDFMVGFTVLKWSAYLAGIPVVLIIIDAVFAKISAANLLNYRAVLVLIICASVFGLPYMARYEFRKLPTLADATTSFDDAPLFVDLIAAREKTASNPLAFRAGEAIEQQRAYFPGLVSLETGKTPAEIVSKAAGIAQALGMEIAAIKPEEGRLEATETTFWFRFKDDLVVRARSLDNGQTQVDIRSASRVGYLDGGVNAKRVNYFLDELAKD